MQNINFDDGYKEISINGDENRVIRFNPSDFGIIERYNQSLKMVDEYAGQKRNLTIKASAPEEVTPEEIEQIANELKLLDTQMKELIDYIFDGDISSVVFGNTSPWSTVKGEFICTRFLNALMPIIEKEFKAEAKASQKRISKYTGAIK